MIIDDALDDFGTFTQGNVKSLGNLGLVAAAFDEFGLEDLINKAIGKEGSHVKADTGVIVKALVMQMLNVPWQTLSGTEEYFRERPLSALTQQKLEPKDLNRAVLGRCLDDIADFGGENLYLNCAKQVIDSLNIKVTEAHIDSTSFHYDGESYKQADSPIELKLGYSRDHRPELKQAITLMLADGQSRIPFYSKNVSGNVNDNRSFNDLILFAWSSIKEQFQALDYLVGDSSLCTADNFNSAKANNMHLVTRLPDKTKVAKDIFANNKIEDMTPVFEDDEESPLGKWCGTTTIGDETVHLLLVANPKLKTKKAATVTGHAEKELADVTAKIKKLSTKPCKCKADALKCITEIMDKCKLVTISNIQYEEIIKNVTRGRPKAGVTPETKVNAVKVTATVSIDEAKVAQKIEEEILYIIATNDLNRKWTMAELLSIYKRQSVIERCWRCCKNPKFFVDAIYLNKPSRIDALLWLMSLALLVYAGIEYKVRKTMADNGLTIPSPDQRTQQEKPTLMRLFQYIANQNVQITLASGNTTISYFSETLQNLLRAMGKRWVMYFNSNYYKMFS
jgi:transposase